jgi:hypothetical protein
MDGDAFSPGSMAEWEGLSYAADPLQEFHFSKLY